MVMKASSDAFFFAPLSLTHYLCRTISRRRGAQRLTLAAPALGLPTAIDANRINAIAYPGVSGVARLHYSNGPSFV